MKLFAIIVAAGAGERFAPSGFKQLTPIAGWPLLAWSVERLRAHGPVEGIVCVIPPGRGEEIRKGLAGHGIEAVMAWPDGGETRQDSVRAGLAAIPAEVTHVLVHDGARPCLSETLLSRLTGALAAHDAVVPSFSVVDTLVREGDKKVEAVIDRAQLSRVQTPQAFEISLVRRAHEFAAEQSFTGSDDSSLVLAMGKPVHTVLGERTNIKVTFPEDLAIAEAILLSGILQ